MLKLLRYAKRNHLFYFIASTVFLFLQTFLDLSIPDYMSSITNMIQTGTATAEALLTSGGGMLLCALGATVCAIITGYFSSKLAASFSADLRFEIFNKVQTFNKGEIDKFSTASLITRSTNDVIQIQNFSARGLKMIVRAPIIIGVALYKMSIRYWQWSAATALSVVLLLAVITICIKYAHPRFRKMQTLMDGVNYAMRENMTGVRVIRAFNAQDHQTRAFDKANSNLMDNERKARSILHLMPSTNQFTSNALTVAIYCIGAFLIVNTASTTGKIAIFTDMVVFSSYASKMLQGLSSIEIVFNMLPRVATSSERILQILDTEASIIPGKKQFTDASGTVEFRNVSFKYPGMSDMAIRDINFTAGAGQTIGIIGSTASGKSTLVKLIPRLYDVTEGSIFVDGMDVRDVDCTELRNRISYVPQEAVLFSGTVEENVDYGEHGAREGSAEERVWQAVDISQAKEFVDKLPEKIKSAVYRGGRNISGGQKQRLSIARGICRKPEIFIFDDTFSALDYKTEKRLRARLEKDLGDSTMIIVSSRIAAVRNADNILVMDEGKIVGTGTHEELLESCRVYKEIYQTQLPD